MRISTAALLLGLVPSAAAEPMATWDEPIAEASQRFGIPADWIRRVMRIESAGNTMLAGRPIRSGAGAMGLMQLMPGTWRAMRAAHGLGADPDNPRDNILAGTAYLRAMYDRFGYPGLFGAYNAGPGRYADYVAGRSRLPGETVAYVAQIIGQRTTRRIDASGFAVKPSGEIGTGLFVAGRQDAVLSRAGGPRSPIPPGIVEPLQGSGAVIRRAAPASVFFAVGSHSQR